MPRTSSLVSQRVATKRWFSAAYIIPLAVVASSHEQTSISRLRLRQTLETDSSLHLPNEEELPKLPALQVRSDGTLTSVSLSTAANARYMRRHLAEAWNSSAEGGEDEVGEEADTSTSEETSSSTGTSTEEISSTSEVTTTSEEASSSTSTSTEETTSEGYGEGGEGEDDVEQVITTGKDTTSTTTTETTTTAASTTSTVSYDLEEEATEASRPPYSISAIGTGACSAHFVSKPHATSPEDCAEECFKDPGCLVFSSGSSACPLGCRISKAGRNDGSIPEQDDGQCFVDTLESDCSFYKLSFFHEEARHLSCGFHYKESTEADTLARCAHECKDHAHCNHFSYGVGCEKGCRISKCGENDGSAACPDNKQCSTVGASGACALYIMDRE